MRLILGLAAAGTALAMAQPASAQQTDGFYTAQQLYDRCKTDEKWCRGYILGAVDASMAYASYSGAKRIFCLPQGADADSVIEIVLRHLEANPAKRQYDAAGQVMLALFNAHPCK